MRKNNYFTLYFAVLFIVFSVSCTKKAEVQEKTESNDLSVVSKSKTFSSLASQGCEENSWSPEILTLYGDGATINRKIENSEMDVTKRRLYIMIVESENEATIKLFEQSGDGKSLVEEWSGQDATAFITETNKAILTNKGIACVGEQTQAIFEKLKPTNKGKIPAPVSAQAAFSHDIKNNKSPYLKVTIYLMC